MEKVKIIPNPAKTMESLRHLTYSNATAIADIVDNSIDAGATKISIKIDEESITITDNGCGMNTETLVQAVTLGSETQKEDWQLGRFGMGLVTAGISLSPLLVVSSRCDGHFCKATLDIAHISEINEWEAFISEDENEVATESGTIVELKKIDNYNSSSLNTTIAKVSEHLAEVFRKFLQAGVSITVNGKELAPLDPLRLDDEETEIMMDQEVHLKSGEHFHIVISYLAKDSSNISADMKIAPRNQGIYVIRNNRQIARALMVDGIRGLIRHPSLNRFRCEISFASELDKDFGINFTKDQLVFKQAIVDKIAEVITGPLNLIKTRYKKETADETANAQMDHSDAEDIIRRKRTLLPNPIKWKEKRATKQDKQDDTAEEEKTPNDKKPKSKSTRENAKKTQLGYKGMVAKFTQANLSESSPLYTYDFEGSTIVITWNTAHPFYQRFVAPYNSDKNISSPVDLLVFSLVLSESQTAETADQEEKFLQFREDMSRSLRTLLKS